MLVSSDFRLGDSDKYYLKKNWKAFLIAFIHLEYLKIQYGVRYFFWLYIYIYIYFLSKIE